MPPTPKTVPFSLFMDVALGEKEFVELPAKYGETMGKYLALIDHDSQFCYVQFPEEWRGQIDRVRIWRIKAWRNASERFFAVKENEADRRYYDNTVAEAFTKLKKYLYGKYPFDEGKKLDREFVHQICHQIVHQRNEETAKQFGVSLADIPIERPQEKRL